LNKGCISIYEKGLRKVINIKNKGTNYNNLVVIDMRKNLVNQIWLNQALKIE